MSNKRKLLEWGLIITVLIVLIIFKYYIYGCLVMCGDWYDDWLLQRKVARKKARVVGVA